MEAEKETAKRTGKLGGSVYSVSHGKLKLQTPGYTQEVPYAHFPHTCQLEKVLSIMIKEWNLDPPKIILLIVSDHASLKGWDSYKEQENFVKGLIKGSNATDMWIFTSGLNIGISKLIGDAFQEDYNKRAAQICTRHAKVKNIAAKCPVIGICRESTLTYQNQFETPEEVIHLENKGNIVEDQKFNLNPYHTNFLIVQDQSYIQDSSNRFLLRLIDALTLSKPLEIGADKEKFPVSPVPVIAILIQGNLNSIHYILAHLKRRLPILVVRGSGGLADVFSYAYHEARRSFQKVKDKDYVETIFRRGLNDTITSGFPGLKDNLMARNLLCERILECIEISKPPEMKNITVLNVLDLTCNMEDLPLYLLNVLFKSEGLSKALTLHDQLKKDLQLTIDWNCPEIALTKVFYKDATFKVENDVFEQALLTKGREEFVSLFLDNGFAVYKYLGAGRLIKLFEHSLKSNFFREVCWEGMLGYRQITRLDDFFIDTDLNWLVENLIGIPFFVSSEELTKARYGMFDPSYPKNVSIDVAKRKALMVLVMWALLSKRGELAMVLWQHVDQPIMTALAAALALDKMKVYVNDKITKEELADLSKQFASMAVGVFDLCYNDTPTKAYESLNVRIKEWSELSLIDMASLSHNRIFVSHPCCQKWLTNKFLGNVKMIDLPWGFMTFPDYIKVILCAFFVFPMYLWVRFKESKDQKFFDSKDFGGDDPYSIPEPKESKRRRAPREEYQRSHLLKYQYPPLWQMIYWMWSAPITKFWVSNIFYIIYLAIFSLAVIWPSCGSLTLDVIVCCWTLLIAVDSMYRLYSVHQAFPNTPLFASILEIIYMLLFVLFYFLLRVFTFREFRHPYAGKILICIGLIYFYYRMIIIYLPISSSLGPLLYRAKAMVTDFVNFMKLIVFILIGNAIAMQALLYPDYPLIPELVRKSFHKAFVTLFAVPIDELTKVDPTCVEWAHKPSKDTICRVGEYIDGRCPSGLYFWPYIVVFQYVLLIKLVLMTVLFALFNATGARIGAEMDSIWKFQRYKLIINFSNSLRLPPPLNIFSVLIILCKCIKRCCKGSMSYLKHEEKKIEVKTERYRSSLEYRYWKQLASDYFDLKYKEKEEDNYTKNELYMLSQLAEDLNMKEMLIHRAKAQIRQLESDICYTQAHLETLKYREKKDEDTIEKLSLHSLSRESPYPNTKIQRFPVPERYVPWEVMRLHYEPLIYTLPKRNFPPSLQPYVDDDVFTEKGTKKPETPVFKWNLESIDANGVYRNRKSWIIDKRTNEPITYRLDFHNLPRNPMGRTGLRGKGALPRWGPNHCLFVIITRWKKDTSDKTDELTEAPDLLEYVETWFMKRKDLSLPGGFAWSENRYELIQSCFNTEDTEPWQSSEDMIKFFKDHAVGLPDTETEKESEEDCTIKQVYCGYMDDQMNTDNAWKEVELWHIHYNKLTNLYKRFKANIRWRVLSEDVFIQLPYGQTTLLQDSIRHLKANIADT